MRLESRHPHFIVGDVDVRPTFKKTFFEGQKNQCLPMPKLQHLILGLGQNRFCCAMDSNTIGGATIMQYSSLDGPNI